MEYLKDKVVLITGAAGSVGEELVKQVVELEPQEVVALEQDETRLFELMRKYRVTPALANIRDEKRVEEIFNRYMPYVVFHAAAYKHVPLSELFPKETYKTNVLGTQNLVDSAKKRGIKKFIFVSTDKAVNPISVMGQTKKEAERICRDAGYVSVRFGNVLGSRGSIMPIWKKQIEDGGPLTITHPEMKRYFMSMPAACRLILKAGAEGKPGEIFVLDMGEPVNIMDLAKRLIKWSGKDIEIKIIGKRPGEKLFEELIGDEEEAEKRNGLYVIKPK